MAKKPTAEAVLNTEPPMTIGGRQFYAHRRQFGEGYLVGRIGVLAVKATSTGDADAQTELNDRVAQLLSRRAVDGEPVTAEWVAVQNDGEVEDVVMVVVGEREHPGKAKGKPARS